ncbi:hypothetical protein Celaphus_00018745 [Cervus elaphus hippelaphus]|uniref:Uncharacterized protein n=1 Tax=Cervus elaphus hippelaphus TaxID=46360 RepID=A0A212C5T6_CEREH|nr:hypothetical protein Celaphus_00018745 [Cervus elaphus hippelaphus]
MIFPETSKNMFTEWDVPGEQGKSVEPAHQSGGNPSLFSQTVLTLKKRTGVSITLITRNDWKIAGELINILERANQSVPEDLVSMAERYKANKLKKETENKWGKPQGKPRKFYH